mmetsp:Transcript_22771/g.71439  ORF Transcript_22771/g.71439 Transcript_22771/m.71439 type:complete len:207 (+) Transcript_22771:321-941(+)
MPPGRAVVSRVAVARGRLVRPHGGRRGRFGLCLGGWRSPVAGVMVVYGPPITHLPPPAVGASPDAGKGRGARRWGRSLRRIRRRVALWGRRARAVWRRHLTHALAALGVPRQPARRLRRARRARRLRAPPPLAAAKHALHHRGGRRNLCHRFLQPPWYHGKLPGHGSTPLLLFALHLSEAQHRQATRHRAVQEAVARRARAEGDGE